MKRNRIIAPLLAFLLLLAACDKLDDSGDGAINSVLPGTWSFSYELQSDDDTGLAFEYEKVIFGADGTCAITYLDHDEPVLDADGNDTGQYVHVYEALHGTYRASNAVIRIDSSEADGQERTMLWAVRSFSDERIVADFDFDLDGQHVRAVVTLERVE